MVQHRSHPPRESWRGSLQFVASTLPVILLASFGCERSSSHGKLAEILSVEPHSAIIRFEEGESSERVATFQLRNDGQTPLRIVGVETFCGCTIVDQLPKHSIPAGSAAALKVKVSLPGSGTKVSQLAIDFAGSMTGRIVVPLELHGRKPDLPFALLRNTGVNLLIADRAQPVTRQLSIETVEKAGDPPWIVGLGSRTPWLTAALKGDPDVVATDAEQVTRRYWIDITATFPTTSEEPEFAEIEFATDSASTKRPANLRVMMTLAPVLKAVPAQLTISRKWADSGVLERKFAVIATGTGPWEFSADPHLPPGITVEKLKTTIGEEQSVVVFLTAIAAPHLIDTSAVKPIRITARSDADYALEIPLILTD
jgi:hypothetical protein